MHLVSGLHTMKVQHHRHTPFSSLFPVLIAIALKIDRFWRHKDVDIDEVASSTWQRYEKWMRPLRRRDV